MNKKIMYPNGSILRKIAFFFKMIQKSSDDYFFATDIKENMTMVSSNMVNDFDLPGEIFYDMNKYWVPLVHPSDREAFIESLKPPASKAENIGHDFEYRIKNRSGEYIWIRCRGQIAMDKEMERPFLFMGSIKRLDQRNHADALTGLLNKYQFERAVKAALNRYRVDGCGGAMMVFGIDNFKMVNETYNRHFGDELLKIASRCVSDVLPDDVMLYKLDGDEYGVVCPGFTSEQAQELFSNV